MAIRTRKTWKPQRDGQYVRQLGWKRGSNGKLTQPKFRLGTDLREAKRREITLTELWEHVEQQADGEPVCWPLMPCSAAFGMSANFMARRIVTASP
jgi:hypothetical protein